MPEIMRNLGLTEEEIRVLLDLDMKDFISYILDL